MHRFERGPSPAEQEPSVTPSVLEAFDTAYFAQLEGKDGWNALEQENCSNQRYFTVSDEKGERLGIVGLYDTEDEKNVSHTVVDPAYRGKGLANRFKELLLKETGESFYVATVDLDNTASLRAMEKVEGIKVTSDEAYEREFHKRRFRYELPKED